MIFLYPLASFWPAGRTKKRHRQAYTGRPAPFLWICRAGGYGAQNAFQGQHADKTGGFQRGPMPPLWHTTLLARCSVLHPAKAGCKNRDGFFSHRGGFTSRKRREKPTPARSVCGVFSRRVAGRISEKHCYRRHACHPKGKTAGFHFAVSSVTDAGGIPTSLSLLSSLSPA